MSLLMKFMYNFRMIQNNWVGGGSKRFRQKKMSSKPLRVVDFASIFILTIKSKFKIHTFNSITNLDAKSTALKDFELNF
jgi:hypothetical protein